MIAAVSVKSLAGGPRSCTENWPADLGQLFGAVSLLQTEQTHARHLGQRRELPQGYRTLPIVARCCVLPCQAMPTLKPGES